MRKGNPAGEVFAEEVKTLKERFGGRDYITMGECESYLRADRRTLLAGEGFPAKKVGGRYLVQLTALAWYLLEV